MCQVFCHLVDLKKKLFNVAPLFLALYSSLTRRINKVDTLFFVFTLTKVE